MQEIDGIEKYYPGEDSVRYLHIRATSGTTGSPKMIVRSFNPKHMQDKYRDVKSFVRVSHLQSLMLAHARHIIATPKVNVKRVLFLDMEDIVNSHMPTILEEFQTTDIQTPASSFEILLSKSREFSSTSPFASMERIYLSAELTSKSVVKKISKSIPNADIIIVYSASEIGPVGASCEYLLSSKLKSSNTASIVHPYKTCTVSIDAENEEGIGEIIISTNDRKNAPTRDLGKLVNNKCACGAKQTLIIYGRQNYDIVYCVGATILSSELERFFSNLKDYVADYFVEVREKDNNLEKVGHLTFRILPTEKLKESKNPKGFLEDEITKKLFLTNTRTFDDLIREGIFLPPTITFVTKFPEMNKKIHLKKVFE